MAVPDVSHLDGGIGAALGRRFRGLGITREYIRRMTAGEDDLRTPLAATREALFSDEPAAIALRLFFCREPVPRAEAEEALGALTQESVGCGLLEETAPGMLMAPFHLRTALGLYLFSDYLGSDPEAVMGAGETTAILFRAARPERAVGRALDLGCGAGTLALLLADRAREVVGTDVNSRALTLARFNAAVNGKRNVEFRQGDVFEPVRGESFDLIVSQPPYYPDPAGGAATLEFLHGGPAGHEIALRVAEGMAAHLNPGGRGLLFTSWPEGAGPAQHEDLRILELASGRRELSGSRQSIDVFEHAPAGQGWTVKAEVAADYWGNASPAMIDRLFAAEDLLRAGPERLLSARLRLAPGSGPYREGPQLFVRGSVDSLAAFTPLGEEAWQAIAAVDGAPDVRTGLASRGLPCSALDAVAYALRRGLLHMA